MGLRNGSDLGAGHTASVMCQPPTTIWFPRLGALAALLWETEQGAGDSQESLRGMWCHLPWKSTAPRPCLWSTGNSYILGQGRNRVGEEGTWERAYGCLPVSVNHPQSCSFQFTSTNLELLLYMVAYWTLRRNKTPTPPSRSSRRAWGDRGIYT